MEEITVLTCPVCQQIDLICWCASLDKCELCPEWVCLVLSQELYEGPHLNHLCKAPIDITIKKDKTRKKKKKQSSRALVSVSDWVLTKDMSSMLSSAAESSIHPWASEFFFASFSPL